MMTDQVKGENDDRVKLRHAAYPQRLSDELALCLSTLHCG